MATTVSVVTEQKTYYLKKNEDYIITGVTQVQNNSTSNIRICENQIDQSNRGWVLHAGKIIGFQAPTTLYLRTPRNANIEFEME